MSTRTLIPAALPLLGMMAPACAPNPAATSGELSTEQTIVATEAGRFLIEANPRADTRWEWVPAPAEEAFRLLADAYDDLGIPPSAIDTRQMIYGNTDHRASGSLGGVRMSRLFSCGRAGGLGQELADAGELRISILTQVQPDGPQDSLIRTEAVAEARGGGVTSARRSACASTGLLEAVIAAVVRDRVDGP